MKKLIVPLICIIAIVLSFIYKDNLVNLAERVFNNKQYLNILPGNEYTKNDSYLYVQKTDDFVPLGYQDILNIYYSIINNHWETFTFYCPREYTSCTDDVTKLSDSSLTLSNINNFVHPYNSFTHIITSIDSNGEIIVKVSYLYTKEQINYINNEVDRIIAENYDYSLTAKENLKNIHDYIINTTKYDTEYEKNKSIQTFNAYGVLKEHLATCNGYSDLMAIILSKLNINNYKIAYNPSDTDEDNGHVWNAAYVDGQWLHIDLTWDDPVGDGRDYLYHKYFLVTTSEMLEADAGNIQITEHEFDRKVYQEF